MMWPVLPDPTRLPAWRTARPPVPAAR